ncbi:hypothetical protein C8Q73DRAFT_671175 [Cubamyces lactineus]|nr:hypothetical protein C8Q73DRAFT_671175 [Cubamyces lactineus]
MNARISATGASRAFRNHTFSRVARSTHLRGTTALPRLQAAGHGWRSYSTETPQEQDAHTSSSSSPAPTLAATASRATFRERPRTFERSPSSSDEDFPRKGKLDSDLSRGTRPMPTLNPSRIRSTDYVDLSNRIFVYLTKQKPHSRVLTSAIYYRRGEVEDGRPTHADHVPFPAGTRGFFYWTANPRLTALGGEIRFRVTNNPSADSMAVGWDLLGPDGYSPWRLSVLQVLNTPLIEYLVDEHLVSPFDIERYHNTRRGHMAKPLSNSQICVQPGHAFVFDFGVSTKNWESIWILGHYFINWISFGRLVRQSNSPRSGEGHSIYILTRHAHGWLTRRCDVHG